MFGDYSISKKLTLMNVWVSGAALTLACVAFIAYDAISVQQGMVETLSTQAQIAGLNSNSALLFNDSNSASNTLSALSTSPGIISAGIRTPDDRIFAMYQRGGGGQAPALPSIPAGQAEAHRFTWSDVVLVRPILFQGKQTGIVFIQSDLRRLKNRLAQYMGIAAAVLACSLLAVLLISPVFRRAIAEPIVHLAGVASIVSRDKDYSVRATPTGGRDELANLIEAFNGMLSQIQERDEALHQAHDRLELRVEERTREVAQSNAELTAANKELESFSYSVSHDLRTPLRSIDGFSQALLEEYSDRLDSTARGYLERVRKSAQRMSCLIDDMISLSRVTRSSIRSENLDLTAMARSITEEIRQLEPARAVEFTIEEGLFATGDSHLMRQALENLIRNSWKYTSSHLTAKIEIGKMQWQGKLSFFVRDDGAGFDPRYTERLFTPFQRLHTQEEFSGTGIGLATVQRIIHRHGGEITAEAAVEKGATFYFTLREQGNRSDL